MRFDRLPPALCLTFTVLCLSASSASAQFSKIFAPKPVTKKPSSLVNRQAPAKISKDVEGQINQENSEVFVSLGKQRAYLKIRGTDDVYIDTPISSGRAGHSTPMGSFRIMEKDPDHRSSIYGDFVDSKGRVVRSGISSRSDSAPAGTRYLGAPMKWFCRLTDSGVGMHVGILPGYPASHGCIRLPADIAPLIYQKVKIGTPVTVGQ